VKIFLEIAEGHINTHVPRRSAVIGLGGVVPSLSVATHEEHLVSGLLVLFAILVQRVDVIGEALPLSLLVMRVELGISRIRPVEEAKVLAGL
jgi:hypothetical protein